MPSVEQKTVIVLGMHRSGTSMAGALLDALGVDMGENLFPQSRANPIGYYEDVDFLSLNQKILHAARGDAYQPPSHEAILQCRPEFLSAIQKLVTAKTAPVWGWKDPRTSLTVGLYLSVVPNPHIIICERSRETIARSLDSRGDLTYEDGLALSNIYEARINGFVESCPACPKLVFPYEEVTRQPDLWIDHLIEFLALKPTRQQKQQALALVLPPQKIRVLRAQRLLEAAVKRPWEIPGYIRRRFFSKGNRS